MRRDKIEFHPRKGSTDATGNQQLRDGDDVARARELSRGMASEGLLSGADSKQIYLSSDCLCFWFVADRAKHQHEQFGS